MVIKDDIPKDICVWLVYVTLGLGMFAGFALGCIFTMIVL